MPITVQRSKPEVEFEYSDRLLLETGNSNISATYGDIWSKFDIHIAFHLLKYEMSQNWKPEVDGTVWPPS